jgi:phosphoribosylglycinamide formyltransferase-1
LGDIKKLAVLVSGNGSNLQSIIDSINIGEINANISLVISNIETAFALTRAKKENLKSAFLNHKNFSSRESFDQALSELLIKHEVDLIVLAGFMRILSNSFIEKFNKKIINIHPSLLPKYPGLKTHEKVMNNKDKYHGVTIHLVDEGLDSGPIIAQAKFATTKYKDINSLITKVQSIEHKLYPLIIKMIVRGEINLNELNRKNFKCYEDEFDL